MVSAKSAHHAGPVELYWLCSGLDSGQAWAPTHFIRLSELPMLVQNLILNKVRRLNLPLRVRSTAAQLSRKLSPYFANNPYTWNLGDYHRLELVSHICIFLACKFEDIHGHLDKIIGRMENSDLEKIMLFEVEIFEFLDFRFSFVNIYQCALAFKYMLEKHREHSSHQGLDWEDVVGSVNQVLCTDIEEHQCSGIQELALSAFDCTKEEVDRIKADLKSLDISYKNVERFRTESRKVKLLRDEDIKARCAAHHVPSDC